MPRCRMLPTASWVRLPLLLLPLLAVAAAHDPVPIAKLPLSQLAVEWADALWVDTDTAPCACHAQQHGESDLPAFTHCYWACSLEAEGAVSQPLLHLLGARFKACAVSLVSGDAYREGAAVMVHSFVPASAALHPAHCCACCLRIFVFDAFTLMMQVLCRRQQVSPFNFQTQHHSTDRPAASSPR
jgi:hypothetical protein